jgi:predicted phosphodiesterase
MTLYAILSDIHGNYPALLAAAADARDEARRERGGPVEFISLGDVVDYGPQPNECVAWVLRRARVTIQGNHDRIAAEPLHAPPLGIDPGLWPIVLWTRSALRANHRQSLHRWRDQPGDSALQASFALCHSDLDESDTYINNPLTAGRTLERLPTPYGLFGHTHIQGGFALSEGQVETVLPMPAGVAEPTSQPGLRWAPLGTWFDLPDDGQRMIMNPGSVGQPRQPARAGGMFLPHDYRAAYLLLRHHPSQGWQACFRRVDYPVGQTIMRMRERISWAVRQNPTANSGQDAHPHPFAARVIATIAAMDTQLPKLVERLIAYLQPAEELT